MKTTAVLKGRLKRRRNGMRQKTRKTFLAETRSFGKKLRK